MEEFMRIGRRIFAFAGLILASTFGWSATNQSIIPIGLETRNGNAADNIWFQDTTNDRWQLFASSALPWSGSVSITGLSFRVDEGQAAMNTVVPRVEIRISTSPQTPATMSTLYSVNVGPDEALVFAHDNVAISSPGGAGPNAFGISFQFDQPFVYNPAAGSLFFRFNTFGRTPFAEPVDLESGQTGAGYFAPGIFTTPVNLALVTEFEWTAVPEPSSMLLIGLVSVTLAARRIFRYTRKYAHT